MEMKRKKLEGLIPATFTPFDAEGRLNLSLVLPYADKLVADGALGVFVCGSTGECASMSVDERKRLLEAWAEALDGRIKLIAHIGDTCQMECVALARHAREVGVDAVGAIAPYYFKPAGVKELVDFFAPVAAALGDIPFYHYNMPSVTGINLSMVDFLKEGSKAMPNLAGIKFTHNNFMEMMECLRLDGGRFDILNGFDEMLLCGLSVGAKGGVGSTYNYALGIYRNILSAFAAGNMTLAQEWQMRSIDVVHVIVRHGGGVRGGKAIMKLVGLDCGNCRQPFAPYSSAEMEQIRSELDAIGFFDRH